LEIAFDFYIKVSECKIAPPLRDESGDKLSQVNLIELQNWQRE